MDKVEARDKLGLRLVFGCFDGPFCPIIGPLISVFFPFPFVVNVDIKHHLGNA